MKLRNIIQMAVLTVSALPLTVSLNSCTEEDIIDNYASILHDSTYFTYNVGNLLEDMWGADTLHIFTYEVSGDLKHNLKHVALQPQDGRYQWVPKDRESDTSNEDRIKSMTHEGFDQRFYYGAGIFRSVAVVTRINPNDYVMDEAFMSNVMEYPSYDVLRDVFCSYKTYSFRELFSIAYEHNYGEGKNPMQTPFWWNGDNDEHDRNHYVNADGEEAKYVRHGGLPVFGGLSFDTLKVGEHKAINFEKIPVMRQYNINMTFKKADNLTGLKVNDIYAIVSGVPRGMSFYYKTYDVENTVKIPFRFYPNVVDSENSKSVSYGANIVMSGFSYGTEVEPTTATNGPGVMQLSVNCQWNGKPVELVVLCNISKSIIESGVISKLDKGWIWGGSTDLEINISSVITPEMLDKAIAGETIIWKD